MSLPWILTLEYRMKYRNWIEIEKIENWNGNYLSFFIFATLIASMMDIPFKKNIFLWPAHSNEEVMPPHKEPLSLERQSEQVVLAVLYHLTIRHDTDVTQSGLTQYSHGRLEILPCIFQSPYWDASYETNIQSSEQCWQVSAIKVKVYSKFHIVFHSNLEQIHSSL